MTQRGSDRASLALLAVAVWLVLGRICQENVSAAAREAIRSER